MRILILAFAFGLTISLCSAQKGIDVKGSKITKQDIREQKGNFYFYWGYNRSSYGKSDITLKGPDYNFTLAEAKARDIPKEFSADYFSLYGFTVPQFNIRIGYFINDKYAISAGYDHMKYRTVNGSTAKISGTIEASASQKYQGVYDNEEITMNHSDFIQMEHSDGFNVVNLNIERSDFLWVSKSQKLAVGLISGFGAGIAFPWTHSKLFGVTNDDRPHFSGLGAQAYAALQGTFYKRFFLRYTGQIGFVNMWDIAITPKGDNTAHAEQTIRYFERSLVLGYQFRIF